jgi:hypothetical protein
MEHVGFATWQLQELETTAAAYLTVRILAYRGIGIARGKVMLKEAESRTFGSLLTKLAKSGVIEKTLALKLGEILEERNWLVHRVRRENRAVLANAQQYDSLIERLEALADRSMELLNLLATDMERYVLHAGVDRTVIDAEADRLARSWGLFPN